MMLGRKKRKNFIAHVKKIKYIYTTKWMLYRFAPNHLQYKFEDEKNWIIFFIYTWNEIVCMKSQGKRQNCSRYHTFIYHHWKRTLFLIFSFTLRLSLLRCFAKIQHENAEKVLLTWTDCLFFNQTHIFEGSEREAQARIVHIKCVCLYIFIHTRALNTAKKVK